MLRDNKDNMTQLYDNTNIRKQEFPADFDAVFEEAFRFPEPRNKQREVIEAIVREFLIKDKDAVLLDAPPGFGKSGVINTVMSILDGKHYYVTPLKSLQDQLVTDEFIGGDMTEIKGRNNYGCVHTSAGPDTTVDNAKCQKEDDWECPVRDECPYYVQKDKSIHDTQSLMNLSYMMKVPMTAEVGDGQFTIRDSMTIDECQGVESWSISNIGFTISKFTLPKMVWDNVQWPREHECEDFDTAVSWLEEEILPSAKEALTYINGLPIKDEDELSAKDRLKEFIDKVNRFLDDVEENHWVHTHTHEVGKNRPDYRKIEFKPIFVGRFLNDLIWDKADKFMLSSATIPKGNWLEEIGLDDRAVTRISVSSPFPVENRPICLTEAVGKMTYNERDQNIGPMVEKIKAISEHHDGQNGIIHCRGYNYIKMFKKWCIRNGHRQWFEDNCVVQDRDNREESLQHWIDSDKQIFLSVNMSEGIDLKGDKCRWQVLMKTLYPNMNDERVSYRIKQMNDWQWYNNRAVIQIEQAYGRAVRGPDDWAYFYVLDESAVNLIERSTNLFHDWFLEACDKDVR
jgi:Rad3-related DNA helicase